jgi:hypothetical protein
VGEALTGANCATVFRGEWSSESDRMWTLIVTTLVFAGSVAGAVAVKYRLPGFCG